jgi:hypothetical protein
VQALTPPDHHAGVMFCKWILTKCFVNTWLVLRITRFLEFVHRLVCLVSETESVSIFRWGEAPTLLDPLE